MRMVLSRQKNDINILADEAEWGLVYAKENKWSQVMLDFPVCCRKRRKICFPVSRAPGQGPLLDSPGARPGPGWGPNGSLRGGQASCSMEEALGKPWPAACW